MARRLATVNNFERRGMLTAQETLLEGFANYTSADELTSVIWDPEDRTRALCPRVFVAPCIDTTISLSGARSVEEDYMNIANDAIFMSYAPREPFTSVKVPEIESCGRYQRWFTNLPEEFQLRQRRAVTGPHVLMLQ